jgi:hypothetical protein
VEQLQAVIFHDSSSGDRGVGEAVGAIAKSYGVSWRCLKVVRDRKAKRRQLSLHLILLVVSLYSLFIEARPFSPEQSFSY